MITAMNGRRDRWHISDQLWEEMKPLLPPRKPHPLGCHRPRVPDRSAMNAILFVMRTGCQWAALDATGICSHASAHRRFMEWKKAGVFEQFWANGLMVYRELKGLDWSWLRLDLPFAKFPCVAGQTQISPLKVDWPSPPELHRPEIFPAPAASPGHNGELVHAMNVTAK